MSQYLVQCYVIIPYVVVCHQDYFFSYNLLTSGLSQPNDRGCRRCGKIGHFVNECPLLAGKG